MLNIAPVRATTKNTRGKHDKYFNIAIPKLMPPQSFEKIYLTSVIIILFIFKFIYMFN